MQIKNLQQLQKLKKGDAVDATFSNIEGEVTEAHGRVVEVTNVSIILMEDDTARTKEYELWRMLSLVCMDRDISFVREGNIMSDLEHVANTLDTRLQRGGRNDRKKSPHRR